MQKEDRPAMIELNNLSKSFGKVKANDNISLKLYPGEILALLGENGSGKTTLMNMLSGIYQPDSGSIVLNGETVKINSPKDAIKLGIGMIHQHFKLVDVFTAEENIKLGSRGKGESLSARSLIESLNLNIDLNKKVYDMSVSEKQTVEILKVLTRRADILVLDEPTAVLTPQEIDTLFNTLREMKKAGKSIIIITHKLEEVLAISDRVAVLHKGRLVDTVNTEEADRFSLTEMMVGRQVDLDIKRAKTIPGDVVLSVEGLTVHGNEGNVELDKISFTLRAGEILGVAGIAGSGQKALCESIAGIQPVTSGSISLLGERIDGLSPRQIIELGISMAFIPEDRLGMGLIGSMNIPDNLLLKTYRDQKGLLLKRTQARKEAEELVEQLSIVTPGLKTPVSKLSGGNVQKVLLGREINLSPKVLITAYPVRGLDIGASMTIYDMLNEQKEKGVAVLFVGEDLDVLLALCDRIMVLSSGKLSAIVESRFATKALIGMKMVGMTTDKEDEYVR